MLMVIATGCLGTAAGFFLSIFLDLAPAPVIAGMIFILGFCVRFLPARKG
jgi:ABC-type Mn2+/Zn2+ transport system permease subunit